MDIIEYNSSNKYISIAKSFSEYFPGINVYSDGFEDKIKQYLELIMSDMRQLVEIIKEEGLNNVTLVPENYPGKTNVSDIMDVCVDEFGEIAVNFSKEVNFNSLHTNHMEVEEQTSEIVNVSNRLNIGDTLMLTPDNIQLFNNHNFDSQINIDNYSVQLRNLTISNNAYISGYVTKIIEEEGDFSLDLGFMRISRAENKTTIELIGDIVTTSSDVYSGEKSTGKALVKREELEELKKSINDSIKNADLKISEFWDFVSVIDFTLKIYVDSIVKYVRVDGSNITPEIILDSPAAFSVLKIESFGEEVEISPKKAIINNTGSISIIEEDQLMRLMSGSVLNMTGCGADSNTKNVKIFFNVRYNGKTTNIMLTVVNPIA